MMRRLPAHRQRPFLRRTSWLAFALGIASLGYVGFSLVDAQVYQAYASWRLDKELEKSRTSPPSLQPGPPAPSRRIVVDRATIAPGSSLGRIEISRIGISAMIMEGMDGKTLRRGVGHVIGTALPEEGGNVALAGHRDTFFRALRDVRQDDEITLTTTTGTYRYRVDSTKVVAPEDVGVLKDNGESVLTLVTCYPFYFVGPAPKRFIVRAHRKHD